MAVMGRFRPLSEPDLDAVKLLDLAKRRHSEGCGGASALPPKPDTSTAPTARSEVHCVRSSRRPRQAHLGPAEGLFLFGYFATPALVVARPRPGDPASGRARLLRDLQVRRAANVERLDFRLGRSPRPGSRPASSANPCRQALGPPRPGQPCSGIRVSYLPNNRRCSWRCANARRSAACSSI